MGPQHANIYKEGRTLTSWHTFLCMFGASIVFFFWDWQIVMKLSRFTYKFSMVNYLTIWKRYRFTKFIMVNYWNTCMEVVFCLFEKFKPKIVDIVWNWKKGSQLLLSTESVFHIITILIVQFFAAITAVIW